jgi:CheY-like chemotaxis protein
MKNVIYADDMKWAREGFAAQFKKVCASRGIEIQLDIVTDGDELIAKVKEGNYDLVFTDNHMERVYGSTACQIIRKTNHDLPIYLISSTRFDSKCLKEFGATGSLEKPQYDMIGRKFGGEVYTEERIAGRFCMELDEIVQEHLLGKPIKEKKHSR